MPIMTNAEIEEGIGKGDIFGLAVDTSIFDRFGCDLRHPKLALLHQLAGSKLQLLLPDVVAREVLDHLTRHAVDSHSTASKALIEYRRRWQKDSPAALPAADAHAEAQRQLNGFLSLTGGKRIPMSQVEISPNKRSSSILPLPRLSNGVIRRSTNFQTLSRC
jgi:hypothetical protein